jgi:hypothetical protein
MSEVVLQCASLTSLHLSGCPGIGDTTLISLAQRCYAVQAPNTFSSQKKSLELADDRMQMQYNSSSIGPQDIWPEATSTLQPNNRVVKFDIDGVAESTKGFDLPTGESTKTSAIATQIQPEDEEEDDEGTKMSTKYGGVIQDYVEDSSHEPLQLQELPITDRSDVTIFVNVHNVFLMEKLFHDVTALTVTDLYVAATHNNSMSRTEPGRISDKITYKKTMEIGDIDEVSKRIKLALSARTSVGALLVYGEVTVPLPRFVDVPGERFRMKIPLSDDFNAKLLKSKKVKRATEDESQEELYKKGKLTGKTQSVTEQLAPTIAVIEITVELASPVSTLSSAALHLLTYGYLRLSCSVGMMRLIHLMQQ